MFRHLKWNVLNLKMNDFTLKIRNTNELCKMCFVFRNFERENVQLNNISKIARRNFVKRTVHEFECLPLIVRYKILKKSISFSAGATVPQC
jgi:hypothetical protein